MTVSLIAFKKDDLHPIGDDLRILEPIVSQSEFLIVAGAAPAQDKKLEVVQFSIFQPKLGVGRPQNL
jgi:hypothetical protein